ncbi:hypothetical protein JZ751_018499 [Albula glossodonta]|uniref:Uncharacterized protein n=1 Tax=Albula glossodonta TaxID=121402 RepID=A0A8T2NZH1_9TELE|nr:hypothetical protein JZ751_018499 [Albula glossodonta]
MGSRRCDSNISALRVPSVWRISVICLIARLHLGATHKIPVCALKDLQLEMVSGLICSWSNGSSICSSLEDCSTKPIICDVNNTQVSIVCRIIYERKALEVESASGQRNSSSKETNNKNLTEGRAVSAGSKAIIVSAVLLLLAVVAAVLFLKFKSKPLQKSYSNCDPRAEEDLEIPI